MIIRLIAIDPSPPLGKSDVLVFQVPERSREFEFLTGLLTQARIEWVTVSAPPTRGDTWGWARIEWVTVSAPPTRKEKKK